MASTKVGLCC